MADKKKTSPAVVVILLVVIVAALAIIIRNATNKDAGVKGPEISQEEKDVWEKKAYLEENRDKLSPEEIMKLEDEIAAEMKNAGVFVPGSGVNPLGQKVPPPPAGQ